MKTYYKNSFKDKPIKTLQNHLAERIKIKLWKSLVGFIILFILMGPLLRLLDPRAAVLDLGVLSIMFFGILCMIVISLFVFWMLESLWYPMRQVRQQLFTHLQQLSSWKLIKLYFAVYFMFLWALVFILFILF